MVGAVQLRFPIDGEPQPKISAATPTYSVSGDSIFKHVRRRNSEVSTSAVPRNCASGDVSADFDLSWLRLMEAPRLNFGGPTLRIADLFAGCGAMSLGAVEGCRSLNISVEVAFAAELDPVKAAVYSSNLYPILLSTGPLELQVDGEFGQPPTPRERELLRQLGTIDMLLGGPPCQGHSDLNNHTRRVDSRNQLVSRVARFAELFRPRYIVIENVQGIRHDRHKSVALVAEQLVTLGYSVEQVLVDCSALGVPQNRRRYMLVAVEGRALDLNDALTALAKPTRSVGWALEDLLDQNSDSIFDSAAVHSSENEQRIQFLFDNALYDLPDEQRPPCHRNKAHSYKSVYGRMSWDEPAPTITTGFGSTGQGRFVHPLRPRTLTPHEAARVQTIPDFFDFGSCGRTQLQKMIGNSVPPLAMAAIATELVR